MGATGARASPIGHQNPSRQFRGRGRGKGRGERGEGVREGRREKGKKEKREGEEGAMIVALKKNHDILFLS